MPSKYKVDDALNHTIQELVKSGRFPDAADFTIKAVFAKGDSPGYSEAASSRKVPEVFREVAGVDFVLVFYTNPWNISTVEQRQVMMVHELLHVASSESDKPALRRHGGNFCEIPEHDKESQELAKQIPIPSVVRTGLVQVTLA